MSQRKARGSPTMPRMRQSPAKARPRLLAGTDRRRSRPSRTRQDLWEETSWSSPRWSRAAPAPRGARTRSLARGRSEASPENAARERSRVRTLRQAFLALQATLPAVPPDTKLSKLDVLVLATSYIAHLTRTLGQELPSPAWPPFLNGLCYLHPLKGLLSGSLLLSLLLKCVPARLRWTEECVESQSPPPSGRSRQKWPMRSRLYTGGLGCSGLDSTTATTLGQRAKEAETRPRASEEADAFLPIRPLSPAQADQ